MEIHQKKLQDGIRPESMKNPLEKQLKFDEMHDLWIHSERREKVGFKMNVKIRERNPKQSIKIIGNSEINKKFDSRS